MPDLTIRPWDVAEATEAELRGFHRLGVAANADWSDREPPDYATAIERLRSPEPGIGARLWWLAARGDDVVGIGEGVLPEHENKHLAQLQITVHPDFRRAGIGTELLRAALPEFAADGRRIVDGWAVRQGGPGELWAVALGFRVVHTAVRQQLDLTAVDPALWDVPAPAGYRAVSWTGAAPDDLVASFARVRNAMEDAQFGDVEFDTPQWTVARVRTMEAEALATGVIERIAVAVDENDGEIAGFTELQLRPNDAEGMQDDTAVLAAHRGHGLGRFVKAVNARWLRAHRPDVRTVITGTGASNRYMIRVNEQIGYVTTRTTVVLSAEIADLEAKLSRRGVNPAGQRRSRIVHSSMRMASAGHNVAACRTSSAAVSGGLSLSSTTTPSSSRWSKTSAATVTH